jgi:hypothetical protein
MHRQVPTWAQNGYATELKKTIDLFILLFAISLFPNLWWLKRTIQEYHTSKGMLENIYLYT